MAKVRERNVGNRAQSDNQMDQQVENMEEKRGREISVG